MVVRVNLGYTEYSIIVLKLLMLSKELEYNIMDITGTWYSAHDAICNFHIAIPGHLGDDCMKEVYVVF